MDNLFVISLASQGDTVLHREFFSTYLRHGAQNSQRDTTEIGHSPLWQSIQELRKTENLDFIKDSMIEGQRTIAQQLYLWNAIAAAGPDGDKAGSGSACNMQLMPDRLLNFCQSKNGHTPGTLEHFCSAHAHSAEHKKRPVSTSKTSAVDFLSKELELEKGFVKNWLKQVHF